MRSSTRWCRTPPTRACCAADDSTFTCAFSRHWNPAPLPGESRAPALRASVFYGPWGPHFTRADLPLSLRIAEEFLAAQQGDPDGAGAMIALRAAGSSNWAMGRFAQARKQLEQALAIYD